MTKKSLSKTAYEKIREELLAGFLVPGDRISEQSIATRFGIGRMPVREAILQLQAEDIMETVTRLGTYLKKPSRNSIVESYELREALESFCCYQAAKKMDDQVLELEKFCTELKNLIDECKSNSPGSEIFRLSYEYTIRYWELDMKFHELLYRIAGNIRMERELSIIRLRERIYTQNILPLNLKFLNQSHSMHLWIVRSIKSREPENARTWGAKHVRQENKIFVDAFDSIMKEKGELEYPRNERPLEIVTMP